MAKAKESPGPATSLVSVNDVADFFGVTRHHVAKLAREEGMPQVAKGKYNLAECAKWYIRHLRAANAGRPPANPQAKTDKARLEKAKADLAELDAQLRRGEVAPVKDFEQGLQEILAEVVQALRRLPGHAHELAAVTEPAVMRLRLREVVAGVQDAAHRGVVELVRGWSGRDAGGGDPGSAPSPKRRQVGGRKKSATRRKRQSGPVGD